MRYLTLLQNGANLNKRKGLWCPKFLLTKLTKKNITPNNFNCVVTTNSLLFLRFLLSALKNYKFGVFFHRRKSKTSISATAPDASFLLQASWQLWVIWLCSASKHEENLPLRAMLRQALPAQQEREQKLHPQLANVIVTSYQRKAGRSVSWASANTLDLWSHRTSSLNKKIVNCLDILRWCWFFYHRKPSMLSADLTGFTLLLQTQERTGWNTGTITAWEWSTFLTNGST